MRKTDVVTLIKVVNGGKRTFKIEMKIKINKNMRK